MIPVEQALRYSVFTFNGVASQSFYLCQTYEYSHITKQMIRDYLNFIILIPQNNGKLKYIYDSHVGSDLLFEQFNEMCRLCWMKLYDVLVINSERDLITASTRVTSIKY